MSERIVYGRALITPVPPLSRREALKAAFGLAAVLSTPLTSRRGPVRPVPRDRSASTAILRVPPTTQKGDLVMLGEQVVGVALESARSEGVCLVQMSGVATVRYRG